jgi:hypothetical protein
VLGAAAGGHDARVGHRGTGRRRHAPLVSPYETTLLRRIADFPEELAAAARNRAASGDFHLKDLAQNSTLL